MTPRLTQTLRQLLCGGWRGRSHDAVIAFEGSRMFLHCASCGYTSPGIVSTTTIPPVNPLVGRSWQARAAKGWAGHAVK